MTFVCLQSPAPPRPLFYPSTSLSASMKAFQALRILSSHFLAFAYQVPSAWETHSLSTWLIFFVIQRSGGPAPGITCPGPSGPPTVSSPPPRCSHSASQGCQPVLPAENEETQLN